MKTKSLKRCIRDTIEGMIETLPQNTPDDFIRKYQRFWIKSLIIKRRALIHMSMQYPLNEFKLTFNKQRDQLMSDWIMAIYAYISGLQTRLNYGHVEENPYIQTGNHHSRQIYALSHWWRKGFELDEI